MSGIVNSTGAKSGIIGTTVGTPDAGATSGMVSNVFRFNDTSSGTQSSTDSTTRYVAQDANSFSAISGRHYVIIGAQAISPRGDNIASDANKHQKMSLYYGTTDRSMGDTTLDTSLTGDGTSLGRILAADNSGESVNYIWYSYIANFTAGSTATHYVYTVIAGRASLAARAYNAPNAPHNTIIYEIMP